MKNLLFFFLHNFHTDSDTVNTKYYVREIVNTLALA